MNLLDRLSRRVVSTPGVRAAPLPGRSPLPEDHLKKLLDAQDRIPERRRGGGEYIHVSSLIGFCARQHGILRKEDRTVLQSVTGGHKVMWRIGRAVENHIREQLLITSRNQGVYGNWTCRCGSATHRGHISAGMTCQACNGPVDQYGEFTLYDTVNGIVGNPDYLFDYQKAVAVVEIKSMNAAQFKDLNAPMGNHILQAGMYYDMIKQNGMTPHEEVVFLYCTKEFKFGSPYKEFHVNVAKDTLLAERDELRSAAKEYHTLFARDEIAPRTMCRSADSALAKTCPVVATCFNMR
jgi:hypothetical protein